MFNYKLIARTSNGIRVINDHASVNELDAIIEQNEGYAYLFGEMCQLEVVRK